ncbi:hypothetical protein AMATHDRAFT_71223 [Amanita thiersii Skay4041]|uniref:DUF6533 domain-containing protein n=1 Tax=Amanita thiersii Skay4041 TaxID=703135 RepID=A0A2A9N713_9AGAR|nr:hypothetical protein AMATHDRAFT_71223 [Amanita thiersii Skay4041]
MNSTVSDQALASILQTRRITSYVEAVNITLLLYDYILTLQLEVQYVWGSRWSLITALYYYTKYSIFLDGLGVVFQTFVNPSIVTVHCRAITIAGGAIFVSGTCAAEAILVMKAWAVWGKGRRLGAALLFIFLGAVSGLSLCIGQFFKSLEFADTAYALSAHLTGCSVTHAKSGFLVAFWIITMALDAIVTLLLLIQGYHAFKIGGNQGLLRLLYRDGLIYFIYMAGMSTINVILIYNLPPGFLLLTGLYVI